MFLNQKHVTNQFKQARNCFINIKVFLSKQKVRVGAESKNRQPS